MRNHLMPVGVIQSGLSKKSQIRNYHGRITWWQSLGFSRKLWTFYNSGKNLFCSPIAHSPLQQFIDPLQWVPFRSFCQGGFIPGRSGDLFVYHLGHDIKTNAVGMYVGSQHVHVDIPPYCLLFVGETNGRIETFLQYQPLPSRLVPVMA